MLSRVGELDRFHLNLHPRIGGVAFFMLATKIMFFAPSIGYECGQRSNFLKKTWRYHSDKGTEFLGACDDWLKELLIHASTTAGYESQSNSIAENLVRELEKRHPGVLTSE